jgi:hypothetical protein
MNLKEFWEISTDVKNHKNTVKLNIRTDQLSVLIGLIEMAQEYKDYSQFRRAYKKGRKTIKFEEIDVTKKELRSICVLRENLSSGKYNYHE